VFDKSIKQRVIYTIMNRFLFCWILVLVLMVFPAVGEEVDVLDPAGEDGPADPIDYIRRSLQAYPIVCLAEGGHQAKEPHEFLRRVLSDESILRTVDVVIVEFAATRHQAVLDAYIRGEDVPFSELSRVWRDTGQSPRAPWDSPLYHELLKTIRKGNLALSSDERVRVVAGDPPIDWDKISTREDYGKSRIPRDPFVASLAMEQAIEMGKRVLIIFGGAHLPRVAVGPEDDLRNSLTYHILQEYPDAAKVISFLNPENLGVDDRIDELVRNKIYVTTNHWTGAINAELVFPEIYSLVTDAETGHQSWQQIPLYSGYLVRDLFDALIYIGPSSDWSYVQGSFDQERDAEYLKELNRRSLLRFGRPLNYGQ
jgi:hypothetical protein